MDFDDKKLHEKFVEYGMNAKEWMRKCVFLLPEIEKRRIWEKKGFSSIFEYAAKLAGMSHKTVIDSLRILKKIEDKPNLQKIAEQKGLNCIKPIITIATKENEKYWAQKAAIMSKNTLAVFVRSLKGEAGLSEPSSQIGDNSRQQAVSENLTRTGTEKIISMELSLETAAKLEKLKGGGSWEDLMDEFLIMREKLVEAGKPEAVKTKVRHIPNPIKRHVVKKTGGVCAFPGCLKAYEILHHTRRFALDKKHDPDSIVGLCKAHERIVHLGLIENEDGPPERWKIREKSDELSAKSMVDKMVNSFRIRYN